MTVQQPAPFQWQFDTYRAHLETVAYRAELSYRNAKTQVWVPLIGLIPAMVVLAFLPDLGVIAMVTLVIVSVVGMFRIAPTHRRMDEATGNLLRVQAGR